MSTKEKDDKETKEKKPEVKQAPKKPEHKPVKKDILPQKENFKGIVRLAGKDVPGQVLFKHALSRVRGIGQNLAVSVASVIHSKLGIDPSSQIGDFSDEQIEQIDKILFNLHETNIPKFMFNRQNDPMDGTVRHTIMNDLLFYVKQDIENEKKSYTWKGYRHAYGQKVRGQRTRNTGRTGMAVGVLRKSIIAAQQPQGAAAATAAPAAGAPAAKPAGGSPAVKAAAKAATAATTAPKAAAKSAEKK